MSRTATETNENGKFGAGKFQAAYLGTTHWLDGSEDADLTPAVGTTTTLVRVVAVGGAVRIAIGGADVEADANDMYVPADSPEYFGINPGQYVSVFGGEACVTECG
jgi:hypothetical protein